MRGPGEFEIIRDFFAGAKKLSEGVVVGIGDDCALLKPPAQGLLATSVDTLVADRHFPADADPAAIAARALRVNLSDLAAMNAKPLWFTLALTLPESDADWLREFSRGLLETAELFGISLVGGDTTRGPLSVTIQVTGSSKLPLRRDGARVGDGIYVSGPVGAASAALPVVLGQAAAGHEREEARRAYYFPEPQLALAAAIGELAGSAVDISDGLLADLGHICNASRVSADVHMESVPVSPLARQLAGENRALELAATGGDDYQLCFTVPEKHWSALEKLGLDIARIGTIVPAEGNPGVRSWLDGKPWSPTRSGYQHF
ncbi:thiamine-phosphate kinase [Microbulbifer rhizosphaerae]|uniref:Thiamine-monophosphate kinase n=1 Tax=Microbulbifer rhizosphaerae TaxID=1562603 RepID=A0A7W4Z928_9GAMM|nr:thiamine-monophosphate kinase [Microbulbifer rhizosphaerae]